jgi:hypothetical protein
MGRSTWLAVDRSLNRVRLSRDWRLSDKRRADGVFNPRCIGITFTPKTAGYLADSVIYLVDKFKRENIYISIVPAMPFTRQWGKIIESGNLLSILRSQMLRIAEFYIDGMNKNIFFNLVINFCFFDDKWSNLISSDIDREVPSCRAGIDKLAISCDGRVYPCFILAANPDKNSRFCAGDIFRGINHPEILSDFGQARNKHFSCPCWNQVVNGNINIPAAVYSVLYKAWSEAIVYIRENIPIKQSR